MAKRAGAALLVTGGALALLLNFKPAEATTAIGGNGSGSTGGSSIVGSTTANGSTGSTASSGTSTGSTSTSGTSTGSTSSTTKSGTYTGSAIQTRYGPLQVQITVSNGKITNIQALQYPSDNPRSQSINQSALPVLIQEALQAQSSQVNSVSGATYTSEGFMQSLQSALTQANG